MENEKKIGHLHPLTIVIDEITNFFLNWGFSIVRGPEKEDEWHNFEALNVPADHPARDMQDTFWLLPLEERKLLRTHTSPVQIRYMKKNKPPFRIISPGRVFRNEATDATHESQFYQMEGLMIDKQVTLANLKGILEEFCKEIFGPKTAIRIRPSFFPFVEPGLEIDISCFKCLGQGCSLCKNSGWIEIMGAGMVHPNVLKAVKIDSNDWRGFAFGLGPDRIAMIKYGLDDIRLLYGGDLRFNEQF